MRIIESEEALAVGGGRASQDPSELPAPRPVPPFRPVLSTDP